MPDFTIRPARSAADLEAVAGLFAAYMASLGPERFETDVAAERASLPGRYAPPAGALFLAVGADGEPMGCVAVQPIRPDGCCELKRLYVAPAARGLGLGRALLDTAIAAATAAGHREMRLDTFPFMTEAVALYRRAGFVPIAAYFETRLTDTLFFARPLHP